MQNPIVDRLKLITKEIDSYSLVLARDADVVHKVIDRFTESFIVSHSPPNSDTCYIIVFVRPLINLIILSLSCATSFLVFMRQ